MGDTDNTSAALALGQTKLPNLLVNPIGNFRLKRRLILYYIILINNVISNFEFSNFCQGLVNKLYKFFYKINYSKPVS
jgi:hypothetical protein